MLQALPFCCGLCPVATDYALWWSLSVVPGCLSNGRLRQQWACTSVGADCPGNGGRPSPTELRFKKTSSPGAFGIAVLFVPLPWPKRRFPGISWPGSLSKSRSIRWICQSALSSLRLPVKQGTRTSALCAEHYGALLCCSAGCRLHQPKLLRWHPMSLLYLGISPFCGQQRSVWKCGPDPPSAHSPRASILGCSHRAILSRSSQKKIF